MLDTQLALFRLLARAKSMTQVMSYAERMFGSPAQVGIHQRGNLQVSDISLPSNLRRQNATPNSKSQTEKAESLTTHDPGSCRETTKENSSEWLGSRKRRSDAGRRNSDSVGIILSSPRPQMSRTPPLNSPALEQRRQRSAGALQCGQLRQPGEVDAHPGTIRCYRDSQHNVTSTALRTGSPGLPEEEQHRLVGLDGSRSGHTRLAQRAHGGPSGDLGPGGEKCEKKSDLRWALPGPSPSSTVVSPKTRPAATGSWSVAPHSHDTPVSSPAREKASSSPFTPAKSRTGPGNRDSHVSNCCSPLGSLGASEYPAQPNDVHRNVSLSNLDESDLGNPFQRRQNASHMSSGIGTTPRPSVSNRVSPSSRWRM